MFTPFTANVFLPILIEREQSLSSVKKLNAAAVMVNDHTAFRVDWMPFAGLKHSGHGIGGIKYSMHDMQIDKMLVLKK